MTSNAIKRIINKDMKELQKLNLDDMGIFINFDENNILNAKAIIIGPKNTPYENGILTFLISFPKDYPFNPPKISYISKSKIESIQIYMLVDQEIFSRKGMFIYNKYMVWTKMDEYNAYW